jgi:hypothetical protein
MENLQCCLLLDKWYSSCYTIVQLSGKVLFICNTLRPSIITNLYPGATLSAQHGPLRQQALEESVLLSHTVPKVHGSVAASLPQPNDPPSLPGAGEPFPAKHEDAFHNWSKRKCPMPFSNLKYSHRSENQSPIHKMSNVEILDHIKWNR